MASDQEPAFTVDWRAALVAVPFLAFVVVVGPVTLILAWLIQRWVTTCLFDSQDRWDAVRTFAWFFGILVGVFYLADIFAHTTITHYWQLSPLRIVGPPTFGNFAFLWTVGLLLAPLLALILEVGQPRTVHRFLRTWTEEEKQRVAQQKAAKQAEKERRARQATAAATTQATTQRATPPNQLGKTVVVETESDMLQHAKEQALKREAERTQFLIEQAQRLNGPPATSSTGQTIPAPPDNTKKKKEKPDLGDGSMESLL